MVSGCFGSHDRDAERRRQDEDAKRIAAERAAAEAQSKWERELLNQAVKERDELVSELRNSPRVTFGVKRILNDPQVATQLERVAIVFSEAAHTPGNAINLHSVEQRFGNDARTLVAAFLQYGLIKAFDGLSAEFKRSVNSLRPGLEFTNKDIGITATSDIRIDGDFGRMGSKSHHLREGVHELLYRLSHFEYLKPTERPRQYSPHEALVGRMTLGAICWQTPSFASLCVPSYRMENQIPTIRTQQERAAGFDELHNNGRKLAGFSGPRVTGASFAFRMTAPARTCPAFVEESERKRQDKPAAKASR